MKKKLSGIFVCMLIIATIIPINSATETRSEYNTSEITDAKIFIRGKPDSVSITGGFLTLISPIFINVRIHLNFSMIWSSRIPKVVVNGVKLPTEEPFTITMENFTGFGTPASSGALRIKFWLLRFIIFGLMYIGIGDITITPLE
jgi:hypothetical protein